MKVRLTRKALIGLLTAAALGGAGAAWAATSSGGSSPRNRYIDDVAHRLGVSPDAVSAAMKASELDRIEEAVAAGRLSKAQGEWLKQRIKEGKGPFFRARFGPGAHAGALMHTLESYLGLSAATIHRDRMAGRSLAQIADATPGKSAKGLQEALESAIRSRVARAVSQGRITKAQQEKLLAKLSSRVARLVNRAGVGPRGLGFGHDRHGSPPWRAGRAPGAAGPPPGGVPPVVPPAY